MRSKLSLRDNICLALAKKDVREKMGITPKIPVLRTYFMYKGFSDNQLKEKLLDGGNSASVVLL